MSTNGTAERFAKALQQTEQERDVEPVAQMFAEDATLSSPERNLDQQGPQGVREFWTRYLNSFDKIRSEFRLIRESDGLCILEWESTGTWKNGQEVKYCGVSLLEVQDGQVHRFATYYDTAALQQPESSQK